MTPLLDLRDVHRGYVSGESVYMALRNITLQIQSGEFIAILGASGSGKSTLMNILGCLDRPSRGTYHVAARATATLSSDELAELRREHFGFIFQRYHLLTDLTALGNVEIPAIYTGQDPARRHARAAAILTRLKLEARLSYRPGQLSGGEQQRVSIARALMNGGEVILADEPTGALDSHVGEEVLTILKELHVQGHTIIIVTHDPGVARQAERIIELRNGELVSDSASFPRLPLQSALKRRVTGEGAKAHALPLPQARDSGVVILDRSLDALRMALVSLRTHRLRTFLAMLGIIIGIASVVSVVALGLGAQEKILRSINALGTNTLDIYPGTGYGDTRAARIQSLRATDALQLSAQFFIDSATPRVSTSATVRYDSVAANARVYGVGDQYFRVEGMKLVEGVTFDAQAVSRMEASVVIDEDARREIFGAAWDSPIGKIILLDKVPARVIGVVERQGGGFAGTSLSVWLPYTTVMARMLGQAYVSSITVRVSDTTPIKVAEEAATRVLSRQHGRKDFFIQDTARIRESINSAAQTMTLLIGTIAAISLVVGGIGVMNIMLVSVTERTREIGVRMAVGARQSDILLQFLIEAVLVCLIGGALGVLVALGLGALAAHVGSNNFPMIFSIDSIIGAFAFSSLIGVIFGFLPARGAARLDPVVALARE
jgi:macrolide transport system ATP-binding/permease protein